VMAVFKWVLVLSLIGLFLDGNFADDTVCTAPGVKCEDCQPTTDPSTPVLEVLQWEAADQVAAKNPGKCTAPGFICRADKFGVPLCVQGERRNGPGKCAENKACYKDYCNFPPTGVKYDTPVAQERHDHCETNKCAMNNNVMACVAGGGGGGEQTTTPKPKPDSTTAGGGEESSALSLSFSKALGFGAAVGVIALIY